MEPPASTRAPAAKVVVQPKGIVLEAELGETIMGAANRLGYSWPTLCGGEATCTVCVCEVLENEDSLSPRSPSEAAEIKRKLGPLKGDISRLRMACQAQVRGDVTVSKRGVRLRKQP